jgi:hypothetical protein
LKKIKGLPGASSEAINIYAKICLTSFQKLIDCPMLSFQSFNIYNLVNLGLILNIDYFIQKYDPDEHLYRDNIYRPDSEGFVPMKTA